MKWTQAQKKIIDYRGGTLLVSAAAGSGKTAVLVQRILDRVAKDRRNIDEFLVVTFTRAAAGQMRTKIRNALEELQERQPDDQHVIKQLSLIHRATITTIDGFCKQLVDENFQLLQIDPSMRIMDETEGLLMQEEALDKTLERAYAQQSDAMLELHGYLQDLRSDEHIRSLLKSLYRQADSMPDPEKWLQAAREDAQTTDAEQLEQLPWMQLLVREAQDVYREVAALPEQAAREYEKLETAYRPKAYDKYRAYFQEECRLSEQVMRAQTYSELAQAFDPADRSYKRFVFRNSGVPEEHYLTGLWEEYSRIKKETAALVRVPLEEILEQQKAVAPVLATAIDLTGSFLKEYRQAKQEKNCMDFGDVEHYALQLLTTGEEQGRRIPSETAKQLRDRYAEILIDEYQDSNDLQEAILTSLARREDGEYSNLFMVGDVKQSIYKFRMARPQLFQRKYQTFSDDLTAAGVTKKIELKQNFRSRSETLEAVNLWFYQLMSLAMGGIDYNSRTALTPGRRFAEQETPGDYRAELYIMDPYSADLEEAQETMRSEDSGAENEQKEPKAAEANGADGEDDGETPETIELEARLAADRIRSLCGGEHTLPVWDEQKQAYRPCEYRDIVILFRALKGWSETFRRVLTEEGIPVYADSGRGYFDSVEVKDLLCVLAVIDNAQDDIALAGALRSQLAGVSSEELAHIRVCYRKGNLWEIVCAYAGDENSAEKREPLQRRLRSFLQRLERWKQMKTYSAIRELIRAILDDTGYYEYVGAMPNGRRRQGNIRMLIDRASAYEKTGYRGLFDFLRYIERVQIHEQDFGEAAALGANENLVRIMTVHKSKGLEFPVVFLCGCGKRFNRQDSRDPILSDAECYLAVNRQYRQAHYYERTVKRNYLLRHRKSEDQAEELRILYVAMTRAQEKLILTGTVDKRTAEKSEEYRQLRRRYLDGSADTTGKPSPEERETIMPPPLKPSQVRAGQSYLTWGVSCLAQLANRNISQTAWIYRVIEPQELDTQAAEAFLHLEERRELWLRRIAAPSDAQMEAIVAERFAWRYPHLLAAGAKGKLSVSEIKKMSQIVDEPQPDWTQTEREAGKTGGQRRESRPAGAVYGTLVHLVMEKLSFADPTSPERLRQELDELEQKGVLQPEERRIVPEDAVYRMLQSSLGRRMARAQGRGQLWRERQFVVGIPMNEVYGEGDETDLELVQGIIDAYFEEDGELILLDYKTDRVSEADGAEELTRRYHAQLAYYRRTLEQLTGKPVRESYLYSFCLGREIRLT